jgi:hypothetical protein
MIPFSPGMPEIVDEYFVRDQKQYRAKDQSPQELSDRREKRSECKSSQDGRPIGREPLYHGVPPTLRRRAPSLLSITACTFSMPDFGSQAYHFREAVARRADYASGSNPPHQTFPR